MSKSVKEIGYVSSSVKLKRFIWIVIYYIFVRPAATSLFSKWRNMWYRLFGAKIEKGAVIYNTTITWAPWNLIMKKNSSLGPNVICYNQDLVILEESAVVSQYTYICTAGHRTDIINNASSGLIIAPIYIRKGAWVGARAFIGMGVEIGEYAIVGAASSVFKDVEPMTIVGGSPGKFLKKRVLRDNTITVTPD